MSETTSAHSLMCQGTEVISLYFLEKNLNITVICRKKYFYFIISEISVNCALF